MTTQPTCNGYATITHPEALARELGLQPFYHRWYTEVRSTRLKATITLYSVLEAQGYTVICYIETNDNNEPHSVLRWSLARARAR